MEPAKSLTSYWVDKALNNKKTVIFVPSLYLLSQIYSDWVNQSYAEKIKIKYILIGSDADVSDDSSGAIEATQHEANGLLLFTDPDEIRKHINKTTDKLVIISTYQSSIRLAEAANKKITFDFGIFDEAHKTVGQVDKQFSLMLNDNKFVVSKRLFMTATPKIYGGKLGDDKILSMDNEKHYGKRIYCYNTGDAINEGRLVDYQLMTILATNKEIEANIKKNKLVSYKDEFYR